MMETPDKPIPFTAPRHTKLKPLLDKLKVGGQLIDRDVNRRASIASSISRYNRTRGTLIRSHITTHKGEEVVVIYRES